MEINDTLDDFRAALFGARIVNAQVVKHLWWEVYFSAAKKGDTELMQKMDENRAYRFDGFVNIAMLLYQIKFWYDLKCRENKIKFSFNKSAREFHEELPWMSEKAIHRHGKLLDELGLISRQQRLYFPNQKKYTYTLNIEHPLIIYVYCLEGAYKYFAKQSKKTDTTQILIEMHEMAVQEFAENIENSVVRTLYTQNDFRRDIMSIPWGHYIPTVGILCTHRGDTISPLTNNTSNISSETWTNSMPDFHPAREPVSPTENQKEKNSNFA